MQLSDFDLGHRVISFLDVEPFPGAAFIDNRFGRCVQAMPVLNARLCDHAGSGHGGSTVPRPERYGWRRFRLPAPIDEVREKYSQINSLDMF
jgi:hypothetical protein